MMRDDIGAAAAAGMSAYPPLYRLLSTPPDLCESAGLTAMRRASAGNSRQQRGPV